VKLSDYVVFFSEAREPAAFKSKIMIMKKIFLFAVLFSSLAVSAAAQCRRHVETAGGFSYCAPAGWVMKDPVSGPYKSFFTPDGALVVANFNVKEEATTLSNDEYMAAALRYMLDKNEERGAEARKVIGWTKFTTDSQISGSRMVYETSYNGYSLRTVQFILDFPKRKVLLTGTTLAANKDSTDKIFDAVARTLRAGP